MYEVQGLVRGMFMTRIRRMCMLLLAAGVLVACGTPPTAATSPVRRSTLQVTVSGSGSVEPLQSAELMFGIGGTVASVAITEGEEAQKGQVLATLDARDLHQ